MTKVNRHRTYGTTPEWRIIAKSLIEPGMGTGRPLLNRDLRKPVKLTRNARPAEVKSRRLSPSPDLGSLGWVAKEWTARRVVRPS
jgi:hypothetical protein